MFETLTVGRLRPQFAWLEPLVGGRAPGAAVTCSVYTFTIATAALCAHNHFLVEPAGLWVLLPDFVLIFIIISCKFLFLIYNVCTEVITVFCENSRFETKIVTSSQFFK